MNRKLILFSIAASAVIFIARSMLAGATYRQPTTEAIPAAAITEVQDDPLPPQQGLSRLSLPSLTVRAADKPDTTVSLADEDFTVKLYNRDRICEISLHDYVIGVVSGEMPASFPEEALKAQAIASRSCTVYNTLFASNARHPDADVCTASSCCQAYCSDEQMRSKWGDDYEQNLARITAAVESTDGLCVCYEGKPIYTPYHSSSFEATEDSLEVWSAKPYLTSVSSPEKAEDVPGFISTVDFTADEFMQKLDCTGELQIGKAELTRSGRVRSIEICAKEFAGTELRRLLGLRSANFELAIHDGTVSITTYGWGHCVGMSQYGARELALSGKSCEEIVAWYYSHTDLEPFKQ